MDRPIDLRFDATTPPAPDATQAQINNLSAANDAKIAELARRGIGIDPTSILRARLAALAEHILGPTNSPTWLNHELGIQQRLADQLADIEGKVADQLARAKLLHGVNGAQLPTQPGPLLRP